MSKQPRKHAELIKAWADGATIQTRNDSGGWYNCEPGWSPYREYRIKPESKPDRIMNIYASQTCVGFVLAGTPNVKLTFDGETGKLKTAEVINCD